MLPRTAARARALPHGARAPHLGALALGALALGALALLLLGAAAPAREARLDVPYFGQTLEWPWGSDYMGDTRALVADNGCALTATAMVLKYWGVDTDPRRLDRALLLGGGYGELSYGGERLGHMGMNFGAIPRLFPAIAAVKYRGALRKADDLAVVREDLAAGRPVVLMLQTPKGFSHAVCAVGVAGDDILINDPLDRGNRSLAAAYGRTGAWPLEGLIYDAISFFPKDPARFVPAAAAEAGAPDPGEEKALPATISGPFPPGPAPKMVRLPGGTFMMGADDASGYFAEEPVHAATVGPFLAAERELTVGEFRRFALATGYRTTAERIGGAYILREGLFSFITGASWKAPGFPQADDEPVLCVSWEDAVQYCVYLSLREGLVPAYAVKDGAWTFDRGADGYRLPTEAEWEFAARGGKGAGRGAFGGAARAEDAGWVLGNSGGRSRAGGLKPPNARGLRDMTGNAGEWCWDRFGQDYYSKAPTMKPLGPDAGGARVVRGGSWASRPRNARDTQRYARYPDEPMSTVGFRLFRNAAE